MTRPRLLLAFLAALFWLTATPAGEAVRVNVDADNAPFMWQHDGKTVGIYPAILSSAFARMGKPLSLSAKPWKRALFELDEGRAGVGGIYKNAERAARYDFSSAILTENTVVYFNATRPIAFRTLADLDGKRVGVVRGWSYGDGFDAARKAGRFSTEEVANDRSNFLKLAHGRIDVALAIEEAGSAVIASERLNNIARSQVLLTSNSAHLAFNKSARQAGLLAQFDQTIAAMKRDGTLARIVRDELSLAPAPHTHSD